ncbi:MAG: hypothetical protein D6739_07670 [Nitrospirae bacterium]|nr:MAG: hypothetical protein D6739_07670 [Nitrospirota bacterium]
MAGGSVHIVLTTEGEETVEGDYPLPLPGEPLVVDGLVEELGAPLELYFTPQGVVAAREATADSSLVREVREALEEAGLRAEVLLDFVLRGARDGAPLPERRHVLQYLGR